MNYEEVYYSLKANDKALEDAKSEHSRVDKELKDAYLQTCGVIDGDVWTDMHGAECCITKVEHMYGYFRVSYVHRNHHSGELSDEYVTDVPYVLKVWKKIGLWSGKWNGNKVEYF